MQQRPAQGLHKQCPRPTQLDQLTSVDTKTWHVVVWTSSSTSTVAVPVVDHRCGQRAQQPRRQARQGAARGCRAKSWQLKPPRAARSSGERSADFEAALRLRGSSVTAAFARFCTPGGRSQRGLRRSPAPELDAASMGHRAPCQGTQWQRLGSMLSCG